MRRCRHDKVKPKESEVKLCVWLMFLPSFNDFSGSNNEMMESICVIQQKTVGLLRFVKTVVGFFGACMEKTKTSKLHMYLERREIFG